MEFEPIKVTTLHPIWFRLIFCQQVSFVLHGIDVTESKLPQKSTMSNNLQTATSLQFFLILKINWVS
jgi:hypothetical protein